MTDNYKKERALRRSIAKTNLVYASLITIKTKTTTTTNKSKKNQFQSNVLLNESSSSFYVDIASTPIKRLPRISTPVSKEKKKIEKTIIQINFKRLSFSKL